jgi:hypothetical protein
LTELVSLKRTVRGGAILGAHVGLQVAERREPAVTDAVLFPKGKWAYKLFDDTRTHIQSPELMDAIVKWIAPSHRCPLVRLVCRIGRIVVFFRAL